MKLLKILITLAIILCVLALGTWFSLRNAQPISLDLMFIQLAEQSLALWIIFALSIGVLLGWLLSLPKYLAKLTALKMQQHKIGQLEKELVELRSQNNLPKLEALEP